MLQNALIFLIIALIAGALGLWTLTGVAMWIDWVGVSNLRQPLLVLDRSHAKQETVAELTLAVDLEASSRGAHLSRFLDILAEADNELTTRTATEATASAT